MASMWEAGVATLVTETFHLEDLGRFCPGVWTLDVFGPCYSLLCLPAPEVLATSGGHLGLSSHQGSDTFGNQIHEEWAFWNESSVSCLKAEKAYWAQEFEQMGVEAREEGRLMQGLASVALATASDWVMYC
jgi:hypothetical protein